MPSPQVNPDVLNREISRLVLNERTILQAEQTAVESSGTRRQPTALGAVGGSTTWGQLGGQAASFTASQDYAIPGRVADEQLENADAAITDTQPQPQPKPRTKQTARKSSGRRPPQSSRSSSSNGRRTSGKETITSVSQPSPPPLSVVLSHMVSTRYRPMSIPIPEDATQHAVGEVGEAEGRPGPARKRLRKSTGGMLPRVRVQGQDQGLGVAQPTCDTRTGEDFPKPPWDAVPTFMPNTKLAGSSRQHEDTSGAQSAHALPSAESARLGGRKKQTARKSTGGRAPLVQGSGAQGPWRIR